MPFSEAQLKMLSGKLSERHIRTREHHGRTLSYVEAWHVIEEANRIFGYDGWDRETVWAECIWQDGRRDPKVCAYAVRMRIRVRAGETIVCREGSGVGHGSGPTVGEAHESALKGAETDAMKRALATFGNLFGLALYDKEQNGVRRRGNGNGSSSLVGISWVLRSATGARLSKHDLPEAFCSALRRALENAPTAEKLKGLWERNHPTLLHLRSSWRDLKTVNGTHYADVLEGIYEQQAALLKEMLGQQHTQAEVQRHATSIDKSELALAVPKRVRDREHLQLVATLPCLICGRTPSHAHHLRFAQPRSMGSKVSDEWAVPLCAVHHRALHEDGAEEQWWLKQEIDALAEAQKLWQQRRCGDITKPKAAASIDGPIAVAETVLAR
jgi:hypothetical protein